VLAGFVFEIFRRVAIWVRQSPTQTWTDINTRETRKQVANYQRLSDVPYRLLRNDVSLRVRNAIHHAGSAIEASKSLWGSTVNDPPRTTCCSTNQIIVFPSADEESPGCRLSYGCGVK